MRTLITTLILIVFLCIGTSNGQNNQTRLVYKWSAPKDISSFPAVLVLGGSEGGLNWAEKWIALLNSKGFGVMALAYFGVSGVSEELEEIPIEYFQNAIDTMKSFKGVDKSKIAVICNSKGTEAGLLLAIQDKSIKLVLASSPSHVVWQCVNRENYMSSKSSWTIGGAPIPFVTYDYSKGYFPIINFYQGPIENPIDEKALIKIEDIKAKVVLFSGGKDQIWPSTEMANRLKKRAEEKKRKTDVLIYNFQDAGHGFLNPYQTDDEKRNILLRIKSAMTVFGGTIEAYENAMIKSLEITLNELENLKNNP